MAWVLFIFFLGFFLFLILKMPFFSKSGIRPIPLFIAYLLKVLAGIGLTLIYTYYYPDRSTADIYKYFDDARVISSALPEHPEIYFKLIVGVQENNPTLEPYISKMHNWSLHSDQWFEYTQTRDFNLFSSNRIITRFNALIFPLSQGNIFTHVLFMCFLSFTGLMALYRLLSSQDSSKKIGLFLVIFLWPSVMLWSSGVLKDGMIIAVFYLMIYLIHKIIQNKENSYLQIPVVLIFILILLITKYYVVLACIPAFIALFINRFRPSISPFRMQLLALGICLITLLKLSYSGFEPNAISILHDKREEALKAAILGNAKHNLFVDNADIGILGFIQKTPEALTTGLFRPFIWETGNSPFIFLSAVENVLLFLLVLTTLFYRDRNLNYPKTVFVWFFISFSLCLAFIIGYTTPVSGGIVRYKTAFLPALCSSLILISDIKKIPVLKRIKNQFIQKLETFLFIN